MASPAGGRVASSSPRTGFVAADLVPLPGLKQPFNFMGRLAAGGRGELEALPDQAAEDDDKARLNFIALKQLLAFACGKTKDEKVRCCCCCLCY